MKHLNPKQLELTHESGIRPVGSTASVVHYSSCASTSDENPSYKNIKVGTLTEPFPQGAVS